MKEHVIKYLQEQVELSEKQYRPAFDHFVASLNADFTHGFTTGGQKMLGIHLAHERRSALLRVLLTKDVDEMMVHLERSQELTVESIVNMAGGLDSQQPSYKPCRDDASNRERSLH